MEKQQIKQLIRQELPAILQQDPEMHAFILDLSRAHFADKAETESRFDRLLEELRREREEQSRRWEAQEKRWEAQEKKWEDQEEKWEAQEKRWEAQEKKWAENQAVITQLLQSVRDLARRHDSAIGALGARWGLYSEASFRNALKGILEEFFQIEVLNITEYDDEGEVFGRPDQVELDIIIKDGLLLICEIKSSVSKSEMYTFERKVRFYERRHNCRADRKLVISPMVDKQAREVAENLGIQVYSYAEEVDPAIFA